ncbi:hypothetical protein ACJJIQ_04985 [Microbulbifer sp. ANSA003]|uniref:hypothetical protein n=1 Tax=Microbulbifer sp. ANSA003 TaxID=3243360 RepID=UPI0040417DEB
MLIFRSPLSALAHIVAANWTDKLIATPTQNEFTGKQNKLSQKARRKRAKWS